jgi:uncharacterized membrane protein
VPKQSGREPRARCRIKDRARQVGGGAVHAAEHAGANAALATGREALHAADLVRKEPFWQAQAVLVGALILYLTLPSKFVVGPSWLMPGLELLLVAGLWFDRPRESRADARRERRIVLVLLAMVAIANLVQLELLVHYLLHGGKAGGRPLLLSSIVIWLTNLAVFALWYWQLDRGGPDARLRDPDARPDFVFPEMSETDWAPPEWNPTFLDYLYLSFTNATAFSPTDTMPISLRVKMLMMSQSIVSLITVLLVAARAINVLS